MGGSYKQTNYALITPRAHGNISLKWKKKTFQKLMVAPKGKNEQVQTQNKECVIYIFIMLQVIQNPFVEVVVKQSLDYYKEFIDFVAKHDQKPYLTNPGLHLKGKIALQTFCFMVPGILSVVEQIGNPQKNITYGGVLKNIPNWIAVTQDRQDITYFFNEQWGNKPAFTQMNPVQFVRTGLGVMKFIQVTSLTQTINLIKTLFALNVALAPTSLYSQLFNFTVQFRSKFKASTIKKDENTSYKFRNKLVDGKFFLEDISNNIFPSFFSEELAGTSLQDIQRQIKGMDVGMSGAYEYLAKNQKQINESILNVQNMIFKCIKTTQNVTQTQLRELEPIMKEQTIQNIPQKVLQMNRQVETFIENDSKKIELRALQMLQGELPVIVSALTASKESGDIKKAIEQGANRKLIIDTGKTFFYNMLKGINKRVPGINVNDLNRLPKDIMLQVNLVNNTSRLNLQKLKTYLSLSIIQLTKMGSSPAKIQQVEQYIKIRNQKSSQMFMNYIKTPMQQIQILRAKGERLVNQGNITKDIQYTLKQMFGQFSQTSKMMTTQFSQVQTHLTAVTQLLEDNKLQLSGLTPQIEQNIRQQFQGFEIKFSNNMSSQIGKITSLISTVQMRTQTSFQRFTTDMINLSRGMQMVLSSLTSISRQIQQLTNTAQIIQGLTQTSVAKQDFILAKLEEFINQVAQKGLQGIYTTKITSLQDLKKSFTKNQKMFEQSKFDQQKNVASMQNVMEKLRTTYDNVQDKVLKAVNTQSWINVLNTAQKIPQRIQFIDKALNLDGIEKLATGATKIKSVLDNGLDIEGILQKINKQQQKLKTLQFNIPTQELEAKINAEKMRIKMLEFDMPTKDMQTKIAAEKARISRISADMPDTAGLQSTLGSQRDRVNTLIQNRKGFIDQLNEQITRIAKIDRAMLDLTRTIKDRDIVTKVDEMTSGVLKNIQILNPYFRNSSGVTVMQKLDSLQQNIKNIVGSMVSSGGSGGGEDKRIIADQNKQITRLRRMNDEGNEQINLLKQKMQAMGQNVKTLGSVIKRLLNQIYSFFLAQTKVQNSIVRQLLKTKTLTNRNYTQAIMRQIQANHAQKLKSLFKAIQDKIPISALSNRNQVDAAFIDIMKYAQQNYGPNVTPRNDIQFDWWQDYYKGNDTQRNVTPTPTYDWSKKDDKQVKI